VEIIGDLRRLGGKYLKLAEIRLKISILGEKYLRIAEFRRRISENSAFSVK
jgi:hypothetical protein